MVKKHIVTILLCVLCGGAGWFIGAFDDLSEQVPSPVHDLFSKHSSSRYHYTNQLLACGDINSLDNGTMQKLRTAVKDTVDTATQAGAVSNAAVYVRDLDNGPWMGLNEKELYYPASLLKLPLVIALYKHEEAVPGFLDKQVLYTKPVLGTVTFTFPPSQTLVPGTRYTIRELARRAIVYSDNEAAALAGNELGFATLTQVFSDLGIQDPQPGQDYQTSVRTYGSFFRILYNASYMNRDLSETVLKALGETEFNEGIVAGVPTGVTVAHKFGEREGELANGNIQLHDCGIIYSPGRPYMLCIMAQAKSANDILDLMHKVSSQVYQVMSQP